MAIHRFVLSLVILASAITSTAHGAGAGPLNIVLPPASATRLTDKQYCQGQLGPGPGVTISEAAAAESWAEDHLSVHLLQADVRMVHRGWQAHEVSPRRRLQASSSGGHSTPGLRFLHIPRTGGTSVEMANMLLPAGQKAFASLFHDTVSCLQASMYQGKSLAETYNITHENMSNYSTLMLTNECYHIISIGTGATRAACIDYHYPVGHSTLVQAYHEQGPTFCVVREPSERILSALKVARNTVGSEGDDINCTVPAYDDAIRKLLDSLQERPFGDGCLFAHQAEFAPYCQHVLHTEALGDEFAALMRSYGRNVTLPPWRVGDDWTNECNIKVTDLSNATRELLYEFLKRDYDLLGYPRPL